MKSFVKALVAAAILCTASANNEFEYADAIPDPVPEEQQRRKLPRNAYIRKVTGHNWSNNITFSGKGQVRPGNLEGVVEAVRSKLTKRIRVRGSKHSFNDIADSDGMFISLGLFSYTKMDPDLKNVTVGAGITYTMLLEALRKHNVALHNMPSLPHLAVIGSMVTGTHGGGTSHQ
jgi:alditol oxidase